MLTAGEITVDNEANANFTVLSLEMKDYPGLLRVVAWVLNGLSLLVENARYATSSTTPLAGHEDPDCCI